MPPGPPPRPGMQWNPVSHSCYADPPPRPEMNAKDPARPNPLVLGVRRHNPLDLGVRREESNNQSIQDAVSKAIEESGIQNQMPPGPPPRPGLQWNPVSHRWYDPKAKDPPLHKPGMREEKYFDVPPRPGTHRRKPSNNPNIREI